MTVIWGGHCWFGSLCRFFHRFLKLIQTTSVVVISSTASSPASCLLQERQRHGCQNLFACLLVFTWSLSKAQSDGARTRQTWEREGEIKKERLLGLQSDRLSAAESCSCFQEGSEEHMCPWLYSHLLDWTGALSRIGERYVYLYRISAGVFN